MPRIACVGNFVMDTVVRTVDHLPRPGQLAVVDEISVAGGGAGFATSVALARLGATVHAVGAVGVDAEGAQIRRWLTQEGVATDRVASVDARTAATVCLVSTAGERTYLHAPGASRQMRVDEAIVETPDLDGVHIGAALILDGLEDEDGGLRLLGAARRRGVRTTLDTSWDSTGRWSRIDPYLPLVDVFAPSLAEARAISGEATAESASEWILAHGAEAAVIHAGDRGAYVASSSYRGWIPACQVDVVDSTGAGECFDAGLIFGLCSGWSIVESVRLACATGALATTASGAVGGMTSLEAAVVLSGQPQPVVSEADLPRPVSDGP